MVMLAGLCHLTMSSTHAPSKGCVDHYGTGMPSSVRLGGESVHRHIFIFNDTLNLH